jgi:hypothetical protein
MDVMVEVCQSKAPALHDNIKYFLLAPHYHLLYGHLAHWLEKFSLVSEKKKSVMLYLSFKFMWMMMKLCCPLSPKNNYSLTLIYLHWNFLELKLVEMLNLIWFGSSGSVHEIEEIIK